MIGIGYWGAGLGVKPPPSPRPIAANTRIAASTIITAEGVAA